MAVTDRDSHPLQYRWRASRPCGSVFPEVDLSLPASRLRFAVEAVQRALHHPRSSPTRPTAQVVDRRGDRRRPLNHMPDETFQQTADQAMATAVYRIPWHASSRAPTAAGRGSFRARNWPRWPGAASTTTSAWSVVRRPAEQTMRPDIAHEERDTASPWTGGGRGRKEQAGCRPLLRPRSAFEPGSRRRPQPAGDPSNGP